MSEESEIRVQLARIEGKQDVTNERLETANVINNERHEAMKLHLAAVDHRLNSHGERLTGLEGREIGRDGERKGLLTSGKLLWTAVGVIPGGAVVALLMRAFQ